MVESNMVMSNSKVFLYLIVASITFIASSAAGAFIFFSIKRKMEPLKKSPLGSEERCGDCPAWTFHLTEGKQIVERLILGDKCFTELELKIETLTTSVTTLTEQVTGLSSELKKRTEEEIKELRQALRDKNKEIENLKK